MRASRTTGSPELDDVLVARAKAATYDAPRAKCADLDTTATFAFRLR